MASKRSICWRTYCLLNHVQYHHQAIANHSSLIAPLISGSHIMLTNMLIRFIYYNDIHDSLNTVCLVVHHQLWAGDITINRVTLEASCLPHTLHNNTYHSCQHVHNHAVYHDNNRQQLGKLANNF